MTRQLHHRPTFGPRAGRIEYARGLPARRVARRSFLRVSSLAGLTLLVGGTLSGFLAFFNLRSPAGFGAPVTIGADRIPRPGEAPVRIPEGKAWLVNLDGPEGDVYGAGAGSSERSGVPQRRPPAWMTQRRGRVPWGLVPLPGCSGRSDR